MGSDVAIGTLLAGISLEYFQRLGMIYKESISSYGIPSDKQKVFEELCSEAGVSLYAGVEVRSIRRSGTLVTDLKLDDGSEWKLSAYGVVVDASYEGDLMALATPYWTVGRESAAQYGEPLAGYNQVPHLHHESPYITGRSGALLPSFVAAHSGVDTADKAIQSYTYRPLITHDTKNMVPFSKPPGYRAELHVWYRRLHSKTLKPPITATLVADGGSVSLL